MKESKKYLIIGIVSTLVLMLGFSLAYFAPMIRGEGKKITVRTGSLAIVFTDTQEITEEEITPGWSTSKTFTIENESNNSYYYNINLRDVVNTFVTEGFLQYKVTSTTGYNMEEYEPITKESFQVLGEGIEIGGLETQEYTIHFRYVDSPDVDQSADMNKEFAGYLSITEGEDLSLLVSFYSKLLSDNITVLTRTDFDIAFTDNNIGTLYKANGTQTEDGSDVYYFAGNAQNNWVKFGKDQEDNDLYWRIIRTNEDGSIRLLYIGPDPATESAFIKINGTLMNGGNATTGVYNNLSNNTLYVGYMYGETGTLESNRKDINSSPIKIKTDEWYSKTIKVKKDSKDKLYDKYVSRTAIYCNDRSGGSYSGGLNMTYASYNRLMRKTDGYGGKNSPTYRCGYNAVGGYFNFSTSWPSNSDWRSSSTGMYSDANVADKFSVSTSKGGNGNLQYPIAQMTADELAFAGAKAGTSNTKSWYYYNSIGGSVVGNDRWWTMSPYGYGGSGFALIYDVLGDYQGSLNYDGTSSLNPGIRPVLSLKSCVKYVSGDGSSATPYEVTVDNTCATLEN